MTQIRAVYNHQKTQFLKEKGMFLYYIISILLFGGVFPLLFVNSKIALNSIILETIILLKPILADSIAMERERNTLEPLLSSPIDGKSLLVGKVLFCLAFAILYFVLCSGLLFLLHLVLHPADNITISIWILLSFSILLTFFTICLLGVYLSARSANTHTANSRIGFPAYLLGLLLIVYLTLVLTPDINALLIISLIFFGILILTTSICFIRIHHMNQFDYYEDLEQKAVRNHHRTNSTARPHSQFFAVLRHEAKYLWTLKRLLRNFLFLSVSPALVMCLMRYYTGAFDLNYGILIVALMIPRIPTNLVAYSVGGEKVYKTGESLLSTPLKTTPMLLAKSCLPVIVCTISLAISSTLMIVAMPVYHQLCHIAEPVPNYSLCQLLLLYPFNLLSCILMVFLSATLSLVLKTPRQGLYMTSVVSYFFVFPAAFLLYVTKSSIVWTIGYLLLILVGICGYLFWLSHRVSRYTIMARL